MLFWLRSRLTRFGNDDSIIGKHSAAWSGWNVMKASCSEWIAVHCPIMLAKAGVQWATSLLAKRRILARA
jgi:hypothetical protein